MNPTSEAARNPLDTEGLRDRVQKTLDAFLDDQAAVLHGVSPGCDDLVDAVRGLLTGGKRLRPAFCYWAWRAAGGPDDDAAVRAAAALELFQAAALIHDDLMDGSDTRRGRPAVHRRFESGHRDGGHLGDGERFGLAGAVLAGDLCLAWSDELFLGCGLDPSAVGRGLEVYHLMRTQLMGGQFVDILNQAGALRAHGDDVERAMRVITYKSGKYTVEHPLLIGARLAGAERPVLEALSAFGLPLGVAFQLRDDLLGVFGDPSVTGKPAGDDLREGKRTVLVALTERRSSEAARARFARLFGDPLLASDDVEELRGIITESGAVEELEDLIARNADAARAALGRGAFAAPAATVLGQLVDAATTRTS